MKQRRTENFILLLVSLACLGLSAESVLLGWEFWVPPIIIIYTALIWIMNITERPHYDIRKVCYLAYAVFALLYHGVHATSFFDLAIVASAGIMGYAFFNDRYMLICVPILINYVYSQVLQKIEMIFVEKEKYDIYDKTGTYKLSNLFYRFGSVRWRKTIILYLSFTIILYICFCLVVKRHRKRGIYA